MDIYEKQKLEKDRFIFLIRTLTLAILLGLSIVYMGGTLWGIIRTVVIGIVTLFIFICFLMKKTGKTLASLCLVLLAICYTWLFLSV